MLPCHYNWLAASRQDEAFVRASVSERNAKARERLMATSSTTPSTTPSLTAAAAAIGDEETTKTASGAAAEDRTHENGWSDWVIL